MQLPQDADEAMYDVKRIRHGRASRGSTATCTPHWAANDGTFDVSWTGGEAGAGTSEEWWIDGPTSHGGVITSVVWTPADGALAVTAFGRDAMVVRRWEWIRLARHRADPGGDKIERTMTDWDEQVVELRIVHELPGPPRSTRDLACLLADCADSAAPVGPGLPDPGARS